MGKPELLGNEIVRGDWSLLVCASRGLAYFIIFEGDLNAEKGLFGPAQLTKYQ